MRVSKEDIYLARISIYLRRVCTYLKKVSTCSYLGGLSSYL